MLYVNDKSELFRCIYAHIYLTADTAVTVKQISLLSALQQMREYKNA